MPGAKSINDAATLPSGDAFQFIVIDQGGALA